MTATPSQPHLPAGEILHDFFRAAADGVDLDLAVDALDLDAAHEAGAAKDLHRLRGAERHGLRRHVLHHADFGDGIFALPEPPGQKLQHRLAGRHTLRHVDDLVADHLVLGDRLAKGLALLGIGDGLVDTDARVGSAARRHADALAVEILHDDL